MWVCVSESFNAVRLTREILEQSAPDSTPADTENLNGLQVILKEKLRSERFLLILDDVWNENERTVWEKLRAPLLCGKEGSKIIVTSRLEKVAILLGTMGPIGLHGLPEDKYWSFFKKCAFGAAHPEEHLRLQAIGKEIAKRLKGSPLAAKTVGALLKDDLNDEHWKKILKSDIWELEQGQDDIMPVLRLSYHHLPIHLQRCFAFCSIFPKDWRIDNDDLIYMWIAEGLIRSNRKKRLEDIGRYYIDDLISKAFFEQSTTLGCKVQIHDLLHDLAESVTKDVCLRIGGDEPGKIPDSVRHLSVRITNIAGLTKYSSILKHLRTLNFLFNRKSDIDVTDLCEVLEKLKSIRILNLANCHLEALPIFTYDLMHLRYMNLSNTGLKVLPDQLCRFYHLEMLILKGSELDRLPRNMNKLINLRHLVEDQKRTQWGLFPDEKDEPDKPLVSMISGISKLACLQELQIFSVEKMQGFEVGQLKTLSELGGSLCIKNLENVGGKEEAGEARLSSKRNVLKLELSWCDTERDMRYEAEEEVLEGLQPHRHLRELKIVGYNGTESPSWLIENHHLKNLVMLVLHGCQKWKELPPLGQLPSLERLGLREMHAIQGVGCGFHGSGAVRGFPSLETLLIDDFPELKEWCAMDDDDQLFPRLRSLEITNCSKLMALPSLPPTVRYIEIKSVGLILLPAFRRPTFPSPAACLYQLCLTESPNLKNIDEWSERERESVSHLKILSISCCPSVYLLPPSLECLWISDSGIEDVKLSACLQCHLPSLTWFRIKRCPHITTLPSADVLQHLTNLCSVYLGDCGELRSIGGLRALVSLEHLEVSGCPKLTSSAADQVEQLVEEEEGMSSNSNLQLYVDEPLLLKVLLGRGLSSLRYLSIKGAKELATFNAGMEAAFRHLTSLHSLTFEDCNSLQCLPVCLKYLSFSRLEITDCPNIQTLPSNVELPTSLEYLYVRKCHPALKERYREGGPERQTIAHIPIIDIYD
ncbi:putative disease resistance protein RGA3 [Typha latifolia]|uniref:putative disease resistance protein RGA3 n=1 Tax=Typha latifolia TaxID=4733 RepID=UPI003C2B0ACC